MKPTVSNVTESIETLAAEVPAMWHRVLVRVCTLTEEGASDEAPRGVVDEGRGKSTCALCKGSAGVADLDISHALMDENRRKRKIKERVGSTDERLSFRPGELVVKVRSGRRLKRGWARLAERTEWEMVPQTIDKTKITCHSRGKRHKGERKKREIRNPSNANPSRLTWDGFQLSKDETTYGNGQVSG